MRARPARRGRCRPPRSKASSRCSNARRATSRLPARLPRPRTGSRGPAMRRGGRSRCAASPRSSRVHAETLARHQGDRAAAQETDHQACARGKTTLNEALNELRVRVATEQQRHEGLRRQRQPMDARRLELAELIERRRRELEDHHRAPGTLRHGGRRTRDADRRRARAARRRRGRRSLVQRDENAAAATTVRSHRRRPARQTPGELDHVARTQGASVEIRETQVGLRQENLHEPGRGTTLPGGPASHLSRSRLVPLSRTGLRGTARGSAGRGAGLVARGSHRAFVTARESSTPSARVNVDAIAEYDALEERHRFLETQHADLVAAKKELLDDHRKINATTRDNCSRKRSSACGSISRRCTPSFSAADAPTCSSPTRPTPGMRHRNHRPPARQAAPEHHPSSPAARRP